MPLPRVTARQGEAVVLDIAGLDADGRGLSTLDGLRVHVDGALPGERVRARLVRIKPTWASALTIGIERPSPHRVMPPCAVFGRCGGCQLQHLDYAAQLAQKRTWLREALATAGLDTVPVAEPLAAPEPYGYRAKAQFPVGHARGRLVIGLFAAGSHRIVDVRSCDVQHPLANRILLAVRRLVGPHDVRPYDEASHGGLLRHVLIRVSVDADAAHVVLVTTAAEWPGAAAFATALAAEVPGVAAVWRNVNPDRTNTVLGRETTLLHGADAPLVERVAGVALALSPTAFFQVNPRQAEQLVSAVLAAADLHGTETVADAYSGGGLFALAAAAHAGVVHAIEADPIAAADARANTERNGRTNVTVHEGPAEVVLPGLAAEGTRADVVILDPPRAGCVEAALAGAAALRPARLVYVSCHPATLARDLGRLAALGYAATDVAPVDLFPQTAHVEAVARCVRVGP